MRGVRKSLAAKKHTSMEPRTLSLEPIYSYILVYLAANINILVSGCVPEWWEASPGRKKPYFMEPGAWSLQLI